jgi:hypothetical protein
VGLAGLAGLPGLSGIVPGVAVAPPVPGPEWFEVEVVTTAANQTYSWRISAGSDVSSTTDWGDGNTITQTGTGQRSKQYAVAGTYVVRIKASFGSGGAMDMRPNPDRIRLRRIRSPIPGFTGLTSLANFCFGCSGLAVGIPTDLLRYVPDVTDLSNFFNSCSSLPGTLPVDLLRYLVNATNFLGFTQNCTRLQLQPDLFGPSPETFFATRTPNFTSAFRNVGTQAGTAQGTAPALWTYTYGGTPTRTSCFTGNSATNLSNWAQIPIAWGGLA